MANVGETAERRERLELVGDGALATAAISATATALVLLVALAAGDRELPVVLQLLSAAIILLAGIGGPAIAWLAHRRAITPPTIAGVVLGPIAATSAFMLFVLLSQVIGWALSGLNDEEWFGALVGMSLVGLAFLGVAAWLVADGLRDLRPDRRRHVRLDRLRVTAGAAVLVYTVVVAILALRPGNAEVIEALAFMLLGAVNGAAAVAIADLAVRLAERRRSNPPL